MGLFRGGGVVLVCVFLCSCGSESQTHLDHAPCQEVRTSPQALWSEFLDPEIVAAQIPHLRAYGLSLYQNIPSSRIGDPRMAELFRSASCEGLEVRAWLTLPEQEGYWPNETNVDRFVAEASRLADWIRSSRWAVDWIVVDMEPDLEMMTRLFELLGQGDGRGAFHLLLSNRDRAAYAASQARFTALVEDLHERGFRVMVVTLPMVLDDLWDGDALIQDVLNIPVDGIPWDEVSFMAYTTSFGQFLQEEISPYLVYTYGRDAQRAYGRRAGIDLGVVGGGGMVQGGGIVDVAKMEAQVAAARAAGIERIHVYSLDGILGLGDPDSWYGAFQTSPLCPEEQATVAWFRRLIQIADRLF